MDIIGILILLEIIIIRLCGLNQNVEVEIINREEKEHYSHIILESQVINDYSTEDYVN